MKKLFSSLLVLSLLLVGTAGAEETEAWTVGCLAPRCEAGGRADLIAEAFAYAAERSGMEAVILRYGAETDAAATVHPVIAAETSMQEAEAGKVLPVEEALRELLSQGVDGVVLVPESMESAVELIALADGAGVPVVVEGINPAGTYLSVTERKGGETLETLPYVAAVCYGDAPSYTAAGWLEKHADSPLMLHCALPGFVGEIQAGLTRALADATYLELADEVAAEEDSVEAGRAAVQQMFDSYTMFYCVFADSAALAEGAAEALRAQGEDFPLVALAETDAALDLLERGVVDMLAAGPASVEAVWAFRALRDRLIEGNLPENAERLLVPPVSVATAGDRSSWISADDCAAAYALAFPEEAEAGESE